jgi:hypothetical protein
VKKFIILLFFAVSGYVVYNYVIRKEVLEIRDNVIVSQASGMDINAGITPPPRYAHITGVVKNIGNTGLSNIRVLYSIGNDTLTVFIAYLDAGGSAEFKTSSTRVRTSNPQYSIEKIVYEEGTGTTN